MNEIDQSGHGKEVDPELIDKYIDERAQSDNNLLVMTPELIHQQLKKHFPIFKADRKDVLYIANPDDLWHVANKISRDISRSS